MVNYADAMVGNGETPPLPPPAHCLSSPPPPPHLLHHPRCSHRRAEGEGHVRRPADRLLDRQRRADLQQRLGGREQLPAQGREDEQLGGRHPRQLVRLRRLPASVGARLQVRRHGRVMGLVRDLRVARRGRPHRRARRRRRPAADRLARPLSGDPRPDDDVSAHLARDRHRASAPRTSPPPRSATRTIGTPRTTTTLASTATSRRRCRRATGGARRRRV